MKKRIIPVILIVLCAAFVLSACTMIKAPETLKSEFEGKGYIVRLYGKSDTGEFKSMANLFKLDSTEGVSNILIADAGTTVDDAQPLIIFFCDNKETTDRVFSAAKSALNEIADFTNIKAEKCNLIKADNAVLVGAAEMIELAKDSF